MDIATRLHRHSRAMQGLVAFFVALTLMGVISYSWGMVTDPEFAESFANGLVGGPITLNPVSAGLTAVLLAVQLATVLAALCCAWRMFGAFATDEPLSTQSASWMKRTGLSLAAVAGSKIVTEAALTAVLTAWNPPDQRWFGIFFGIHELVLFTVAGIIFMAGRVLVLAAQVRAEQRSFV